MPFKKGQGGRPKGATNLTTRTAKEAFQLAFDKLGGWEGLAQWASKDPENRKVFYSLYARLIPTDVTSGGKELKAGAVTIERVLITKENGAAKGGEEGREA